MSEQKKLNHEHTSRETVLEIVLGYAASGTPARMDKKRAMVFVNRTGNGSFDKWLKLHEGTVRVHRQAHSPVRIEFYTHELAEAVVRDYEQSIERLEGLEGDQE